MNLFIFPGQGAQYRGIGSDLYAEYSIVRDTYTEASDALGFDIAKLSFEADEAEITLTKNTQPVLVTHHIACLRVFNALTDHTVPAHLTAGHSLGEYSALVAADKLAFSDALQLVRKRGELMSEFGTGEMMALTAAREDVTNLAQRHYCDIAGCNLPDQTVVGGQSDDLALLEAAFLAQYPKKRAVRLKTEGAFHTYYMTEAAREFRAALEATTFNSSDTQVLANVDGNLHEDDPDAIRSKLFYQLINPVLWYQNLMSAYDQGVTAVYEFGGGIGKSEGPSERKANLESMVKKAYRKAERSISHTAIINNASLAAATQQ